MSALLNQVFGLPVSFDSYIRHGWVLTAIQPGTKGPKTVGWNKRENCITDSSAVPAGWGVGLCHAYSGTMALDIDNYDISREMLKEHGIDLDALFAAPDAVTINSGNPGHGKLIYQVPFNLALPSKKISRDKITVYELRCATSEGLTVQDLIPPSRHPSGTTYQWGGNGNWQRLPMLPEAILNHWQALLAKDTQKTIKLDGSLDASWDEIKRALEHIDPDINRDDWINIGMAMHYAGEQTGQSDQAYTLWNDWSAQGNKYQGVKDINLCWRSFHTNRENSIKLGTLFHIAFENGYRRPLPDATYLFSSVEAQDPEVVFDSFLIPPPHINLDLIPPVLRQRASEVSESIGCDPLVPLFAGMATVCAAADARIRLELMPGWKVPPVLWLCTIGDPAEKKTPAAKPMMGILKQLEKEDTPRYQQELLKFEALDAAYTASKKSYLKASEDPAMLLTNGELDIAHLPVVAPQPTKPVPLRMTVADVTSQKLARMCADRPRGMLCHLDEMKGWADKLTSLHGGDDRSTWTQAYEANSHTLDRVGDGKTEGSTMLDNFALSIYGNIQPAVFMAKMKALSEDGLIQRYIPAILRAAYTKRGDPIPDSLTNIEAYEQMVRKVYATPVQTYTLSSGAFEVFRDFQLWYEALKADERLLRANVVYMTAIGKLEGTTGRLMLILHLITDPYVIEVSAETASRAVELIKSYIVPAFRYAYGDIGGMDTDTLDKWIAEHIVSLSGDKQAITLSDIVRSARRQVEGHPRHVAEQMIMDTMQDLEQRGWVQIVEQNKKTIQWAINPMLAIKYKAHRRTILEAKQRLYDHIYHTSNGAIKEPRKVKGLD